MREVQAMLNEDIHLGRRGENLATCVTFDVSEWHGAGEGTVHLLHQRNGDMHPYPCAITVENGVATWIITASDVEFAGRGKAELQYLDGEVCIKSAVFTTKTLRALGRAGEEPPAPHEGWVHQVLEAAGNTEGWAEEADASARSARESATQARGAAQTAATDAANAAAGMAAQQAAEQAVWQVEGRMIQYTGRAESAVIQTDESEHNSKVWAEGGVLTGQSGGVTGQVPGARGYAQQAEKAAGAASVHVGTEAPEVEYINVWINPEGDTGGEVFELYDAEPKNLCALGSISFVRTSGNVAIGSTLEAGKTYTLSADVASSDTDSTLCCFYLTTAAGAQQSTKYTISRGERKATTFVCPNTTSPITKICFYASGKAGNSEGDTAALRNIQIEEGSSATEFEPHDSASGIMTAIDRLARDRIEYLGDDIDTFSHAVLTKSPVPVRLTQDDFVVGGISESGANSSNTKRIRTVEYLPIGAYSTFAYEVKAGHRIYVVFYGEQNTAGKISTTGWLTESGEIPVPDGAAYYRMQYASAGDAVVLKPGDYRLAAIGMGGYALSCEYNDIVTKTKWLAVGDSITFGVYSYMSGSSPATGVTNGWVKRLAKALGYDITVMASRGMGYTAAVTGQDPLDSSQPRINLDTLLTRIEALTDDFNLITVALGINDYATKSAATVDTVLAGLDMAIERLMAKFPVARLVVITPFNSSRQGDASTNYSYGAAYGNRTLKDIADAIKARCEAYGVECIYASNGFLINNFNIKTLLPDNTHPSDQGHTLIAKNMAHYLMN